MRWAWLGVGLLEAGCGGKTALRVPDAGRDTAVADPDLCVELPLDGGPIDVPLETTAQIGRADVVFVIDTTASMKDELDRIREQLRDVIAPAVSSEIPDATFGVATFADFPVAPHGETDDRPFELVFPMTSALADVQGAVNGIHLDNGLDAPESQVEALYQLATGEGLTPYVPASFGCPSGGFGFPCFRDDAAPIVLLFTDAPMHNGPGGANPYSAPVAAVAHTYEDALGALRGIHARVIGFDSGGGEAAPHLRTITADTGAIGRDGRPLVYDIGRLGERLGSGVVEAMKTFATSVVFDVDAIAVDGDTADGVDPREFIDAIAPLRADPPEGVASIDVDAGVFRGVRAGTTVVFQMTVHADAVVPGPVARRVPVEIVFRGDGRTHLGSVRVDLLIPGADGSGCGDGDNTAD